MAIVGRIAGFHPVAKSAVVAVGVVNHVDTLVSSLIARVIGASNGVGALWWRPGLAVIDCATRLDAVAEGSIVTVGVVADVDALIGSFIAGVVRASDGVRAVRCGTRLAIVDRVTRLDAVAKGSVVTRGVVRRSDAVNEGVACVNRARNAVVAGGVVWRAAAPTEWLARVDRAAHSVVAANRFSIGRAPNVFAVAGVIDRALIAIVAKHRA